MYIVTVTDADDALVPMEKNTTAVIWITICAKFDALKNACNQLYTSLKQKMWELIKVGSFNV